MENTDLSMEEAIELAVEAGRKAAERTPTDAFKATERRLYALPILREKLERDRERLVELLGCDTVTVWRNRRRLVQRIAVRLYGAAAVK